MSNLSDPATPNLPASGFVRLPTIIGSDNQPGVFPVSKTAWYAGIRRGDYPPPVKLGPRVSGWRVEDIRELIANGPKPDACSTVGARPRHAWLAYRPTAPKPAPVPRNDPDRPPRPRGRPRKNPLPEAAVQT